jgi:head-tail adaptor
MFERTRTMWRKLLGQSVASSHAATAASDDDRREWQRYQTDISTTYKLAGQPNDQRLSAFIRNVSLGGVNLLSDRPIEPGQMLSMELPRKEKSTSTNVLACVVHCALEKEGQWSLGCTFSRELPAEDLEELGGRRNRDAPPDKRQWKRFQTNVTAAFQLAATDDRTQHPGKVLDISASGVRLLTDRFVENGSLLSVELHNADGSTERTMLACIVHILQQNDGQWILGCNFIRSLSDEDLDALV